jgi:aryl-alcohol dehydrogenase-like predicted oxidoreductase
MKNHTLSRRQFIGSTVVLTGAALMPVSLRAADAVKRTATDQVELGNTGIKLSRLGFGTGSNNGRDQVRDGKDGFIKMIHYAYDHGITYFDTAPAYRDTFGFVGDALKGLPREKLFIQSKVQGNPQDVMASIDQIRKSLNTDYIDSLLVHGVENARWPEERKRVMDAIDEAKSKKWIRAKGVSHHGLPALRVAAENPWPEVHLTRINPIGKLVDGPTGRWGEKGDPAAVVEQIKIMGGKKRGVIAMKVFGCGQLNTDEDREKSIRFIMATKEINACVIGFANTDQIDYAIKKINAALAEA